MPGIGASQRCVMKTTWCPALRKKRMTWVYWPGKVWWTNRNFIVAQIRLRNWRGGTREWLNRRRERRGGGARGARSGRRGRGARAPGRPRAPGDRPSAPRWRVSTPAEPNAHSVKETAMGEGRRGSGRAETRPKGKSTPTLNREL